MAPSARVLTILVQSTDSPTCDHPSKHDNDHNPLVSAAAVLVACPISRLFVSELSLSSACVSAANVRLIPLLLLKLHTVLFTTTIS